MRVVRVLSRLNVGGPAVHVLLLSAGLDQRGYHTELIVGRETAAEGNMQHLATELGVTAKCLPALGREIRPLSDLRVLFALRRSIRRFRPHIVHTHAAKAGLLGRLAARSARVPVVVHTFHGHVLRGYFGPLKTALLRWLERRMAPLSDMLIAVSESVARDLVSLGVADRERFRVLPLGLRLEPFTALPPKGALRAAAGFDADCPLVGIVGRLVPIKDLSTFLEAAVIARKSLPKLSFSVIGDGQERSLLEKHAARVGLAPGHLHFHGWHDDLRAVYGDLDVVVNCSLNEGTPVALIEAMASGCRVVATAVGGTPDLLGQGRFGSLVPPGDPPALAAQMVDVAGPGAQQARERAQAARRHVLHEYSSERLVADMDALYRELLEARGVAL